MFQSCPGAEPISGHTNIQTDIFGYYIIDIIIIYYNTLYYYIIIEDH
jgi:hypothetical protein